MSDITEITGILVLMSEWYLNGKEDGKILTNSPRGLGDVNRLCYIKGS